MNTAQGFRHEKTEKNPRGAGRRPGGDLELARMREGVKAYVREEQVKGHTPCDVLLSYVRDLEEPKAAQ